MGGGCEVVLRDNLRQVYTESVGNLRSGHYKGAGGMPIVLPSSFRSRRAAIGKTLPQAYERPITRMQRSIYFQNAVIVTLSATQSPRTKQVNVRR